MGAEGVYGLLEEDLDAFFPFPGVGILGAEGLFMSYFIVFLLFRRMMIPKILQSYSCFLRGAYFFISYIYY